MMVVKLASTEQDIVELKVRSRVLKLPIQWIHACQEFEELCIQGSFPKLQCNLKWGQGMGWWHVQSVVQNLKLMSKPPIQQVSLAMYHLPSQECILCTSLMTWAGEHNCIAYAINTANNLLQCMVALVSHRHSDCYWIQPSMLNLHGWRYESCTWECYFFLVLYSGLNVQ